jgi:hypothetical protein
VKPLTFSPSQAARLLREAHNKVENLIALISTGDPTDAHFAKIELRLAKEKLRMLEQVPVRRKKVVASRAPKAVHITTSVR